MNNRLISLFICCSVFLTGKEKELLLLLERLNTFPICLQMIEGGLTNINYFAEVDGFCYFIRHANKDKEPLGTSWSKEYEAIELISSLGISPKLVLADPNNQIIVTEFIQGHEVDVKQPTVLDQICDLLHILHKSNIRFSTMLHPLDSIYLYINNAKKLGVELPCIIFNSLLPIMEEYDLPDQIAPCHLDLHQGNFLYDGEKMWILDWEYAAMSHPLFDLANMTSTDRFSMEEMHKFLKSYLKQEPTHSQLKDFCFLRSVADLRWFIWCHMQNQTSEIKAPFIDLGDLFLQSSIYHLELAIHGPK